MALAHPGVLTTYTRKAVLGDPPPPPRGARRWSEAVLQSGGACHNQSPPQKPYCSGLSCDLLSTPKVLPPSLVPPWPWLSLGAEIRVPVQTSPYSLLSSFPHRRGNIRRLTQCHSIEPAPTVQKRRMLTLLGRQREMSLPSRCGL